MLNPSADPSTAFDSSYPVTTQASMPNGSETLDTGALARVVATWRTGSRPSRRRSMSSSSGSSLIVEEPIPCRWILAR